MKKLRPIELTFCAVFVCLMAIGANITVWFPMLAIPIGGATVPLSLQTFIATIAGVMLGRKLGSLAMITYILVGIAGVPVFAKMAAGPMALINPTGGFILSFVLTAFVVGAITQYWQKASIAIYSFAALTGLVINYIFGVTYMYISMNTWLGLDISYMLAWSGMIPFLIKDAALAGIAAFFMVSITKRIPKRWLLTNTP
ncbi:biotin transporter BioY [Oceanobacillus halotolerans]|uniref:biotin transporter BioY n=1 Tax=Oceanobacillus halotolerans TaxID=2663380 RepID=UPI0013DB5A91|nr:biotin transporter BioY [Oceanobacillus halotolerans]